MEQQNGECEGITDNMKVKFTDCVDGAYTFPIDGIDEDVESESSDYLTLNANGNCFENNDLGEVSHDTVERLDSESLDTSTSYRKNIFETSSDLKMYLRDDEDEYFIPCTDPEERRSYIASCKEDGMGVDPDASIYIFCPRITVGTINFREPEVEYDRNGEIIYYGLEQTEWGLKQVSTADSQNLEFVSTYREQNPEILDSNADMLDNCLDGSVRKNKPVIEALYPNAERSISQDQSGENSMCTIMAQMGNLNLDEPDMMTKDYTENTVLMEKLNVVDEIQSQVLCIQFKDRDNNSKECDKDSLEAYEANESKIGGVYFSNESKAMGIQNEETFEVVDFETVCIKDQDCDGAEVKYKMKKVKEGDEFVYTFLKKDLDSKSADLSLDVRNQDFDKYGEQREQNE